MLFAHLIQGHQNKGGERDGEERDRRQAMKLVETVGVEIAIEKSEAHKDEEDVGAEDPQGGLAQCREGFDRDDPECVFAQPEEKDGKSYQVDNTQWADPPLVERNGESLCRQVGAEPAESDSDEEKACGSG